MADPSSTYIL